MENGVLLTIGRLTPRPFPSGGFSPRISDQYESLSVHYLGTMDRVCMLAVYSVLLAVVVKQKCTSNEEVCVNFEKPLLPEGFFVEDIRQDELCSNSPSQVFDCLSVIAPIKRREVLVRVSNQPRCSSSALLTPCDLA